MSAMNRRYTSCPTCGRRTVVLDRWSSGQCDDCFEAETIALAHAYAKKSPSRWTTEMWLWRFAFAAVLILLVLASFTDKKHEPIPTRIGTACVVVTQQEECK